MANGHVNLRAIVLQRQDTTQERTVPVNEEILTALRDAYPSEEIKLATPASKQLDGPRVVQYNYYTSIPLAPVVLPRPVIAQLETQYSADVIIHHSRSDPRRLRLAVFDMDSTLIQQEVIDLLASHAGVEAQVADITSRAMEGELDFTGSLKERVGLLKGLPENVFEDLKPKLTLTPGADVLLKVLRKQGIKTALLSGGFMPLATYIGTWLGIDHVYANELEVDHGKLTGRLKEGCTIVNGDRKRELLLSIAASEGALKPEVLAVGDGANDLPMLGDAGLGVAVNAKLRVQQLAPCKLNCDNLTDVLHVLGFTRQDILDLDGSG